MSNPNWNDYYKKFATVSVNQMIMSDTSKCSECKTNLQEFSIFIGDAQRLSTLYSCVCSDCLPKAIKEAIKVGLEDAKKEFKKAEERKFNEDVNKYNL